jgi:hypothetical protein
MKPLTDVELEFLKTFDALPDDAIVPDPNAALVLGVSPWTLKRHDIVPRVQITPKLTGRRAGNLRAVARGKPQTAA